MIEILTPSELDRARVTGRVVGDILQSLKARCRVGTNLLDIDRVVFGGPFWSRVAAAALPAARAAITESPILVPKHPVTVVETDRGADVAAVGALLRDVPGVVDVRQEVTDHRLWSVTCTPETRGGLLSSLVAAGHVPWLVRDRGMELDEIYQRYFTPSADATEEAAA